MPAAGASVNMYRSRRPAAVMASKGGGDGKWRRNVGGIGQRRRMLESNAASWHVT